jgi:argininosuccinate synthase
MIAFAKKNKIPVEASAAKPYSTDRNLLHISFESGVLEDPWFDASSKKMRGMYKLSVAPEDAPDEPEYIDLAFKNGNCVNVTQVSNLRLGGTRAVVSQNLGADSAALSMSPLGVMKILNKLGGKHGIGRVDIVENRFVGMKGRGVYETPGGAILHFAHRQMETLTMDREVMHLRDSLIPKYATLVYNGFWFSPEREALQALVTETQRDVTGVVRLKLYKGNIIVAGRKSPKSLYDPRIATMEGEKSAYNQSDATGFIRLNALRLKVPAALKSSIKR